MRIDRWSTRARSPRLATIGLAVMGLSALGASAGASIALGASHSTHLAKSAHSAKASKSKTGSDLGALSVTTYSSAISAPFYNQAGEDAEASVPYSYATLATGGIGEGLASVFWPGPTGAHGGDVLDLLGLNVPKSVSSQLNDPEIAESQTGVGAPSDDKSRPGVTMKAASSATDVSSEAGAAGDGVPAPFGSIVGSTSSQSSIRISGPRTVTTSTVSTVHDITIAKVIQIGAVTSTAQAVTDGHKVTGLINKTVVSGMKIAGVAVTLDNKGLHVPGKTLPIVGNTAAKAVNAALKSSGVHLEVTKPTQKVKGPHATLDAGALVVSFGNAQYKGQANSTGNILILGGANLDAIATPGFPAPKIKPVPSAPSQSPAPRVGSTGGTPGTPGTPGIPGTPGTPIPATASGTSTGGNALSPVLAANPISLPKGLAVWWIVFALLGAGLFAFGMKRLPDRVLQSAGPTCSLEE